MVQIVVVCLILFLAGYLFSKENIFSPTTIVSAVWLVTGAVFLFITSFHEPVSSKFTINMLLWIVCFSIASLSIQSFSFYVPYKDILPNRSIRNLYLLICIITLPILLYDVYQIVTTYSGGNIYSALRNANVRGDKALGMESTSRFFVVFWIVSYTLELICASKKNVWRIVFLLALNIFFAFISMGKTNMLVLFMITATILLFKKKISIKKIGMFSSASIKRMEGCIFPFP